MKREASRKFLSAVLAFSAVVFIFLSAVCLSAGAVLNKTFLSAVIKSEKYVNAVKDEVLLNLESLAIPGGLPNDFFDDYVNEQTLKTDILHAAESSFKREEVIVDDFKTTIKGGIEQYAAQNTVNISEETNESIEQLVTLCTDAYKTQIDSVIFKIFAPITRYAQPWAFVCAAVTLLFSIMVLVATKKIGGEFFIKSSLYGSAVMVAAFPIFMFISGSVSRLGIINTAMFFLVTRIVYTVLGSMLLVAFVIVLFVLIFKKVIKRFIVEQ